MTISYNGLWKILYERLALSRDKEGVKKLSTHGQVIEEPSVLNWAKDLHLWEDRFD